MYQRHQQTWGSLKWSLHLGYAAGEQDSRASRGVSMGATGGFRGPQREREQRKMDLKTRWGS